MALQGPTNGLTKWHMSSKHTLTIVLGQSEDLPHRYDTACAHADCWVGVDKQLPLKLRIQEQTRAEREGRALRGKPTATDQEDDVQIEKGESLFPVSGSRVVKGCIMRWRDREIFYVHWASKAYEDESVFMSEAHLGWQRQIQTGPSGSGATSSCAWNHGHLAVNQHTERGYHQTMGTQA